MQLPPSQTESPSVSPTPSTSQAAASAPTAADASVVDKLLVTPSACAPVHCLPRPALALHLTHMSHKPRAHLPGEAQAPDTPEAAEDVDEEACWSEDTKPRNRSRGPAALTHAALHSAWKWLQVGPD